jgi:hypothetical protein
MSRDGSQSQLKSLENVDQQLLDKLEGAGVRSVSDLATSTASELLDEYYQMWYWFDCPRLSTPGDDMHNLYQR